MMNQQIAGRITDVERLNNLTFSNRPEVRTIIERKRAHCSVLVCIAGIHQSVLAPTAENRSPQKHD